MTVATQPPDAAELVAEITTQELNRVLGMPRERELDGDLAERAAGARAWYAAHGAPYVRVHWHAIEDLGTDSVLLDGGRRLSGQRISEHLRRFQAHALVGIAVSAGSELDRASAAQWQDGRPDEGYFLERLGVAGVERLLFRTTLECCQRVGQAGETLTPHLSPGCGGWELSEQHALWALLFSGEEYGPITLLESGGLAPKNSLLAVAGITRSAVVHSRTDACRSCGRASCGFRRAPCGGSL